MNNNNNKKGIAFMISSAFFFALMSFFVKYAADVPLFQKAFFRNAIAAVIALPLFLRGHHSFNIGKKNLLFLLCRVSFGAFGMLCNYYALEHMNLPDANMLNKTSPFFSMLAAIWLLGERPTKRDWISLAIAFLGALMIMKPSFDVHFLYAIIGVAGGFGAGMAYAFVRKLGTRGVDSSVMVLAFSLFTCLICTPFSIYEGIHVSVHDLMILMCVGISAAIAQFSVTLSYSAAETRVVSIYGYTQIIFAAILGIIFFGEVPDALSVAGYVTIIAGALIKQGFGKR